MHCPHHAPQVLGWTRDIKLARDLSWQLAGLYGEQLKQLAVAPTGLRPWLDTLANYSVPCALVSSLDKGTVRRVLERMHLHDHFGVMVTAEDDMETMAQR